MKILLLKSIIFFLFLFIINGCKEEAALISTGVDMETNHSIDGTYVAAFLSLYQYEDPDLPPIENGNWVNVYKLSLSFNDDAVSWSNLNKQNAAIVDSFLANSEGWHLVDVTTAVKELIDNNDNYLNILLKQDDSALGNLFYSSDYKEIDKRPKLNLFFLSDSGMNEITIQQGSNGIVSDTYIWEADQEMNFSNKDYLWVGNYIPFVSGEKQSIIKFDLSILK